MTNLKHLFACTVVPYLFFAFVEWSYDPTTWHIVSRFIAPLFFIHYVLFFIVVSVLADAEIKRLIRERKL